jgi:AraC-like DNA-binding protein
MKPVFFKIPKIENSSIRVQWDEDAHFYDKLHYHPEYQITKINKGEGFFFGGSNMIKFQPEDIFLIGPNIPHLLKSSKEYYGLNSPGVSAVSIFFKYDSFGEAFFEIPEMRSIKDLLASSRRVLKANHEILSDLILTTAKESSVLKILNLLQILEYFLRIEKHFLSSEILEYELKESGFKRLNRVLNYIFSRASENINVEEIAEQANLSRSQFSRFFKERTGKSFISFLNEVRIENACSQLLNTRESIEKISYDCGFQNVSNFNRQFKKIKKKSPSQFRSEFSLRL